jgi:hypothetical protein
MGAASSLAYDPRGPDLPTARALLDDMRALAEKRDEAALWELLAKAPKSTQQIVELETEGVRIRDPSPMAQSSETKRCCGV